MKYCSKCGAELNDDAMFCKKCGASCSSTEYPTVNNVPNSIPNKRNSDNSLSVAVVMMMGVIVIGVILYFMVLKPSSDSVVINSDDNTFESNNSQQVEHVEQTTNESIETTAQAESVIYIDFEGFYSDGNDAECMEIDVGPTLSPALDHNVTISIIRECGFEGKGYSDNGILYFYGLDSAGDVCEGQLTPNGNEYIFEFTNAYWNNGVVQTGDRYYLRKKEKPNYDSEYQIDAYDMERSPYVF